MPNLARRMLKPTPARRPEARTTQVAPPTCAHPTVVGPYRVGAKVSSGGMAEVFRAHPIGGRDRQLVIKAMHRHLATDSLYRSMFVREARLCSQLVHPNIVRLEDFFATDGGLYLILEYIDGLDLRRVLKTCAARSLRVPPVLAAFIIAHLLEALDYAHTATIGGASVAVVHRDLSPSNVLLSWQGHIKLADFGVAQVVDMTPEREKALLTGKFGYMSPEQVRGEALDARSDLFSTGVVLAELLMSRRLFRAGSTAELLEKVDHVELDRLEAFRGDVPSSLDAIVRRALARDKNDRYAGAGEFRDDLTDWMASGSERCGAHALAAFLAELRPQLVPD